MELPIEKIIVFELAGKDRFYDHAVKNIQRVHAEMASCAKPKTEAQKVPVNRPKSHVKKNCEIFCQVEKCISVEEG